MSISQNLADIKKSIPDSVTLVAVSKTKPISAVEEAYAAGERNFGENRVQELVEKEAALPKDIKWHMIGHLQSKKVKHIVSFVHLIHGIDSIKLLETINHRAKLIDRKVNGLIQVHIAQEQSKFGFNEEELDGLFNTDLKEQYPFVNIQGFMGMATFSEDENLVRSEFRYLKSISDKYKNQTEGDILSMGMSGDYQLAIDEGSNMVRIGSSIFGNR